jgi:hypothetical protein
MVILKKYLKKLILSPKKRNGGEMFLFFEESKDTVSEVSDTYQTH